MTDDGAAPPPTPAWANSIQRREHARTLPQTRPDAKATRVLDIDGVSIVLRGKTIVDAVTFFIPKGEFVCLCGPNGAGKSTLLKAVMGLLEPTEGKIAILGDEPARARHKVGYVPQRKSFDRDFPARSVELIAAALRGKWPAHVRADERERAAKVLAKVGGAHLLDKPLAGLSGGETQRVFLARALITNPALVILDEPTAGVDVKGRTELLELMGEISRSDELAAILVTHNLAAVARTAERIVYLEGGRLLGWGLPDEMLGQASLTALAFAGEDHARAKDEEQPRMNWLTEPMSYEFMQRALYAGLAVSVVCAVIGVFVVQRGLAFLGDGLAHAAFGGIAIGLWLGSDVENAVWLAIPFTVGIALGIGFVLRRSALRGDVATGVFFSFSFALGVLFLGLRSSSSRPVNVESLLFGSILAVSPQVLHVVLIVAVVALIITLLLWSRLAYAIFDPELAAVSGVPVALLDYLLLTQTAVVIVVAVKTVGVVLVSSFIVIPAAAGRLLGATMARATWIAVILGAAGAAVGLILSFHLNVPTGATIILTHSACFAAALVIARVRR